MDRQQPETLRERSNQLEITTLAPDDWQVYRDLRLKAHSQEPTAFRSTIEEVDELSEEYWRESLAGGKEGADSLLFAKSENEFIGFVGTRTKKQQKLRHVAEIFFLFVDAKARARGVGAKLLQSALDKLKISGQIKKVKLGVYNTQTAAKDLYEKFGFQETGTEHKELFDGQHYYDHILMEKQLN